MPIPGQPPQPGALPAGCAFHPRCAHAQARCRVEAPVLAPVGAPGCLLRIDAVITDPAFTSITGTSQVTLPFANDPALIGRQLFTQYLVVDSAANALGITFSNAVRTTIGGWL